MYTVCRSLRLIKSNFNFPIFLIIIRNSAKNRQSRPFGSNVYISSYLAVIEMFDFFTNKMKNLSLPNPNVMYFMPIAVLSLQSSL